MAKQIQFNTGLEADYAMREQQLESAMREQQLERGIMHMLSNPHPRYMGTDMATNAPPERPALFTNRQRLLLLLTC